MPGSPSLLYFRPGPGTRGRFATVRPGTRLVAFLSLEGKDKINYMATGAMIVVNIGMDLLFATAFHDVGIAGLGIATSVSQWVYLAAAGWVFLTPKTSLSFSLKNIQWKETWGLLKTGFPNALALFLLSIRSSVFNNLLGTYDPTMISVAAVVSYTMLTLIIAYALLALVGPVYAVIYWKRMPKTLSEWVTIPADFGAPENECLDASIHTLEEAVSAAKEVGDFCRERGLDEKKANAAALALEELCLGVIKERFETDPKKKKHTIELRVVHKEEDIFMSMKDDCKPFNPKERSELVNPQDDSPKSISIRVFMGS